VVNTSVTVVNQACYRARHFRRAVLQAAYAFIRARRVAVLYGM